jgi:HEAT repeat protein
MRLNTCIGLFCFLFLALIAAPVRADDTSEIVDFVVELLSDDDKEMRAVGLEQVRKAKQGEAATQGFAAALPKLSPDAQVGLLKALAARGDKSAHDGVLALLDSTKDVNVRVAAVEALGDLGTAADLSKVLSYLAKGTNQEMAAARTSLVRLRSETVGGLIAAEIAKASATTKVALIEILTTRRALDTLPTIVEAAVSFQPDIRAAAMVSLGEIAGPEQIGGMVTGILKSTKGRERTAAEKQLLLVTARIKDPSKRDLLLLLAIRVHPLPQKLEMLSTLGRVGGPLARKVVEAAIRSQNADLHALGIEAICNWPDASVAERLLQLAVSDTHDLHRSAVLRTIMRIAPLSDGRSDAERLALLKRAMSMSRTVRDRKLALDRARTIRTVESLRFILPYVDRPETMEQACLSVVELAHDRTLRVPNMAEFEKALNKVIATSKDATVIDRAERYKIDETWVRPGK